MSRFKAMLKSLTESYIFIPIFVLLSMIAIVYGYCFVAEHEILSFQQKALNDEGEYKIKATCRPISAFTSAPYISVRRNGVEILSAAVNTGYDFTTDCLKSSIKQVELLESENKIRIYMRGGTSPVKEIQLLYQGSSF